MGSALEPTNPYIQGKLLVGTLEEKAKWTPNETFMRYPGIDWETKGYEIITWSQYAQAIDKVAYWLDDQLGKTTCADTIAYFGPNDPRYAILMPATIKTGRKILIPDGRNTTEGLEALLASTDCKAWIYAEDDTREPLTKGNDRMPLCALPSLDWILKSTNEQRRYPYDKTFDQAANDVILIIHTSGTTGVPKPIYHTNGMWSAMGSLQTLSRRHWPRGISHEAWFGMSRLNCCAPQWLAGLVNMILAPIFMDGTTIMLPPDTVGLSPGLFKKLMEMNRIDGLKCPPHTIVTLYEDPEARALLRSLKFVLYLGAALDRSIGDDLCQYTKLTPLVGSTETGDQFSIRPASRKLWYTHDFAPEIGGRMVRIDPVGADGSDLHELVLHRQENETDRLFQPAFWNPTFHGIDQIETKELYTPILDSDGRTRWVFSARKDDLTKLNWLAKFHAHDIEARIQRHPDVKSVCVGGEGRPAPYVIIEMKEGVLDCKSEEQLLEELYTTVKEKSNIADNKEIHIPRETVFVAKREKPFRRNLKQVVLRKGVEQDYQAEIEQAYLQLEKVQTSAMAST